MRANQLAGCRTQTGEAAQLGSLAEVIVEMFRIPMNRVEALRQSDAVAWLTNGIFCLTLWISLLAAIWVSRGWIGVFFSGQILSTGVYLFQRVFKRTQYAFCTNNGPSPEFERGHHEP
jgi:hypothetical protein